MEHPQHTKCPAMVILFSRLSYSCSSISTHFSYIFAAGSDTMLLTGPHAFGSKYVYIWHEILMKQPHDCSY